MTPASADEFLDASAGDPSCGGPDALAALIAAAAAPHPDDAPVPGEQAALHSFVAAQASRSRTRRWRTVRKAALANLVAAKVAMGAAAAAATGAVVLAAATGNLPGPLQRAAHAAFGAPGTGHETSESSGPTEPSAAPSGGNASSQRPGRPSNSATPSPSLAGLCRAYRTELVNSPGRALADPAFSALIAAAGGKPAVGAYCGQLIGPASTHPSGPASSHPSGPASSHPSGPPSARPSGAPTSRPTAPPSTHPDRAASTHPSDTPDWRPLATPSSELNNG